MENYNLAAYRKIGESKKKEKCEKCFFIVNKLYANSSKIEQRKFKRRRA